jgi:predicted AAA+ superfamily ATPase
MRYMPRIADEELAKRFNRSGALLVRGPKWCGKTSTCQ